MNIRRRNDHSVYDADTDIEYYNISVLKSIFAVGLIVGVIVTMAMTIILLKI